MDRHICRGCSRIVIGDPVSLLEPAVRDLYEKCTYQSLPDPASNTGPLQICLECHNKCKEWLSFKTLCHENERLHCQQKSTTPPPSDSVEFVDGSMEDVVLHVEEDEEDLLTEAQGNSPELSMNLTLEDAPRVQPDQQVDHSAVDWWVCHVCDAHLKDSVEYRTHLQVHLDEDRMPHEISKRKATQESLTDKRKKKKSKMQWHCPLCVASLDSRGLLQQHLSRVHCTNQSVSVTCPICPPPFALGDQTLFTHVMLCHIGNFKCSQCLGVFKKEGDLESHNETVHKVKMSL